MTRRGFTLVEVLVGSFIFLVIALSAYKALEALMTSVTSARAKAAAALLANEQVEIIRNIQYEDVGIVSGIPVGVLPREQTVQKDSFSFELTITIRNVDDPFDGIIGGSPNDTSPADYRSVDLDIVCLNCKTLSPLRFTTLVAPRALEIASTNGALFIQVFDAGGLPVSDASVHIENTSAIPNIVIDELTDNEGWVKIVDAPPGVNAYNIRATKSSYSGDQTYPIGGEAGPEPLNPDATVVVQAITEAYLSIDRVGSIKVSTKDATCLPLGAIGFSLTGTKLIGEPNILKYPTQNFSTDATGTRLMESLEWDSYAIALTGSGNDLAGASALSPFSLAPAENKEIALTVVPHLDLALLVSVKDQAGAPIDGATIRLVKDTFDETKTTSSGPCPAPGQAFWNGLASGAYNLTVSKAGFQTWNGPVGVTSSWQNQIITLSP